MYTASTPGAQSTNCTRGGKWRSSRHMHFGRGHNSETHRFHVRLVPPLTAESGGPANHNSPCDSYGTLIVFLKRRTANIFLDLQNTPWFRAPMDTYQKYEGTSSG